ncbi:single-stranded DNA-binding protein [Sphingobium naphthae]|uniref:single-stranded DNA-binding protein n=1 Tax=Sphingobium naphthae TaxID=1886786 RepID=UPI003749F78E
MQIVNIAGNLGKDAEFKTTQGGDPFCRFSVAVTTGWGDRKATTWWDVTRWGKNAEKLAPLLTKGTKVAVSGEISTREHEGKTYLQIRADHVTLQGGAQGNTDRGSSTASTPNRQQEQQRGFGSSAGFDGDLDDEVPF